ncbi:MAG: class I SAM-dependent methyltransferase [Planctomycetes bacterium]|nr:class I SAM-dependent methyltransferase [Planctomycetota bacterium]
MNADHDSAASVSVQDDAPAPAAMSSEATPPQEKPAKEKRSKEKDSKGKSKNKGKAKQKDKAKKRKDKKARKARLTAEGADRHDLYQRSVNSPETDVDFTMRVFQDLRGRPLRRLREDFCGTAALAAEFLSRDPQHRAEGFDLDPLPIEWGKERNFGRVDDGLARMDFQLRDVREPSSQAPDMTLAQNFSYFCFKTRKELLGYFRAVHANLAVDGVFQMDLYGGPDSMVEQQEERDIEDGAFTYVWDQKEYWPATGEYRCAIHFRFRDGTELTDAFEYEWRLWTLPELKDILAEAGFKETRTYFEGTDPEDEESGNGEFEEDPRGENCLAWIGYLVSLK